MTDAGSDPTLDTDEPVAPEPHALLDGLRARLGADLLDSHRSSSDAWARVDVDAWLRTAEVCRHELDCQYFSFLSGMDWLPNPSLDGEKVFATDQKEIPSPEVIADPAIRMGGGTSQFQVVARVYNVNNHIGLTLIADLDDRHPAAPSWTPVYRGADWHEREAWEMFGFNFPGHPGLRNIYLPEEFEGHPLRKGYPLLARVVRPWPGLVDMEEMPKAEESAPADE